MQPHLIEQASKVIPSTQFLVNVISRRVRQLMNGHRPLVETTLRMGFADIALTEVIEGKVTYEQTVGFFPEYIAPHPTRANDVTTEKRAA
jgi:DNA-directed RNA polymerase subunit omega